MQRITKLLPVSILFITCFCFAQCKKNNDNSGNPLVGSWEQISSHVINIDSNAVPPIITITDSNYVHGNSSILKFTAGSLSWVSAYGSDEGIYTVSNSKIYSFALTNLDDYKIKGDTLILSGATNYYKNLRTEYDSFIKQ
jgi:hypothetical protein